MKLRSLLVVAWLAWGCGLLVVSPALAKPAANPSPGSADDQPGAIPGMTIPRPNGGFLGLEVTPGRTFKLSFYDGKKKPVDADVTSAVFHWEVHYQPNAERAFLTRSADGKSLESPKSIRSPLTFVLYMSLFAEGKDDPVETHVVDFHG